MGDLLPTRAPLFAAIGEIYAERSGILLQGLGGTNGGVIGALAAVGLAATEDDGRIVHMEQWGDELTGLQPIRSIRSLGVRVYDPVAGCAVKEGTVNLVKKLRPNLRNGHAVLFVRPNGNSEIAADYEALKLP